MLDSLSKKYYSLISLFPHYKLINIYPINFEKAWWISILPKKWWILLGIFFEILQGIYFALEPVIIGYSILSGKLYILVLYISSYFLLETINRIVSQFNISAIESVKASVKNEAYKFCLTTDPVFHTNKSSGQTLSKINRGANEISKVLEILIYNIVPVISEFATVVIALLIFNLKLGLVATFFFVILTFINAFFSYLSVKATKAKTIQAEDYISGIEVETLAQNNYIRSIFATTQQIKKIKNGLHRSSTLTSRSALGHQMGVTATRIILNLSILVISLIVFDLIKKDQIETAFGIGIIITYLNGSSGVVGFGTIIRDFSESMKSAQDLFGFIKGFGSRNFPVLADDIN